MDTTSDGDLAVELTGLCTFLVQGPQYAEGDVVEIIFARDRATDQTTVDWLPLTATLPDASRDALVDREGALGSEVILVRATLSRTGGFPRDSMNRPSEEYDPDALTLSDVRIIDRRPASGESSSSDTCGDGR